MRSIKNKLLTGIILINSMILVGILVFRFGFENFYIKHTSKELSEFGEKISNTLIQTGASELDKYIPTYSESENISVDVYDKDDLLIFTNGNIPMGNHRNNMNSKGNMYRKNRLSIKDEYKVSKDLESYIIEDKSKKIEFLATITLTDDNLYSIVCRTPISAIKNSVTTASNFLLIIFVPITILSIFMAIWFSNKFTKPIRQLTHISNKISNLNFDEKVNIHTNDEIETLGNSINTLSLKVKNYMDDLKVKNEELEILIDNKIKQEKLRREFVSSVSHELKTPITVINGYAEGLRSDILNNEEDKQYYIDVIFEESKKMGLMVNDLLDLYKLESNTFKITKGKVDLEGLIRSVVKKHEFILSEKLIDINLNLQKIYILGDKIRLEQVFNNLIDNAINHTFKQGEIKIYTKLLNDDVYIGIYNTGENINENDFKKIWYSFVRLDKARSSSDNRVGLGLSIVREIITLHDGKYGVENKENGVEFWIKLKSFIL